MSSDTGCSNICKYMPILVSILLHLSSPLLPKYMYTYVHIPVYVHTYIIYVSKGGKSWSERSELLSTYLNNFGCSVMIHLRMIKLDSITQTEAPYSL